MSHPDVSSRGSFYYLGPPVVGAVALFLIVAVRMLARLPRILQSPSLRAQSALALVAVSGAGFVAGAAYVALGRPARRIRVIGPYVAGVITIAAYMGALLLVSPYVFEGDPMVKDRSDLITFAVITLLFGLLAGHSWFRVRIAPTVGADPPP